MDDHPVGHGPARDATMLRTSVVRAGAAALLIIGLYAVLPVSSTSRGATSCCPPPSA